MRCYVVAQKNNQLLHNVRPCTDGLRCTAAGVRRRAQRQPDEMHCMPGVRAGSPAWAFPCLLRRAEAKDNDLHHAVRVGGEERAARSTAQDTGRRRHGRQKSN